MRLHHRLCAFLVTFPCIAQTPLLSNAAERFQDESATAESQRLQRLSAIAGELQDQNTDTAALVTEAAALLGFAIWSEDRTSLVEPTGSPRLNLVLTDAEIRAYALMFREGHSVALDDFVGAIDVLLDTVKLTGSCGPFLRTFLLDGWNSGNASARALAMFVNDLGVRRPGNEGRVDHSGERDLDPIQTLLLIRVLTEDVGVPLRRELRRQSNSKEKDGEPRDLVLLPPSSTAYTTRSAIAAPRADETPGWAEDAYAGGVTGLFGEASNQFGKVGQGVSSVAGKANALATIAKFIATYTFLRGEVGVDAPGQPLVRTKNRDAGDERTLYARFTIDGTRVTDWMKDNRLLVALAGLDLDMPKTGSLKGVETEWDIFQDRRTSANHLIQTVRGQPDITRIKTDENGEARIRVEGCPQRVDLDPKEVMPLRKTVRMVVTPQVKSVELQQDLVDAVTGAIGIAGGPVGFLTPVIETLYRMKWKGGRVFDLEVRDWQPGETIGQGEITIRASGTTFTRTGYHRTTIDRSLVLEDVRMQAIGADPPEPLDPEVLKRFPPSTRRQIEEGHRIRQEMAKKRTFLANWPGRLEMHVHDTDSGTGETGGCGNKTMSYSHAADADRTFEWAEENFYETRATFVVEVDLDAKTATLNLDGNAVGKAVSVTRTSGSPDVRTETETTFSMFGGLELLPPFDRSIVLPLKETEVIGMNVKNYYGAARVPIRFGEGFQGNAIVSYSVTRKVDKSSR